MDLLGGYDSQDDSEDISGSNPAANSAQQRDIMSDDSEDLSDSDSVDSATVRQAEANARLRDFGETSAPAATSVLPSALSAFTEVAGPPSFLDPEATRPLATSTTHGMAEAAGYSGGGPVKVRQQAGKDFDISALAPPLKGQQAQHREGFDKRDAPAGAILEGKAKRYKTDEEGPEATQQYSALQIAMMGGNVPDRPEGSGAASRGAPSKPMPVSDFLDKGVGGAQLPRKGQDKKDKEKNKREKGQSTHATWKSEAEMVLRQQYD